MRHLSVVVAATCLCLIASAADAQSFKRTQTAKVEKVAKAKRAPKVATPAEVVDIEMEDDAEDNEDAIADTSRTHRVAVREEDEEDEEDEQDDEDADDVDVIAPAKLRKATARKGARAWNVAFGPYIWASAIDADVQVGGSNVASGIDFEDMSKNAKFGIELLAEVRVGRISAQIDFMYGVVGIASKPEVGPVAVAIEGEAGSLNIDGLGGFRVYGSETSTLAVEARAGLRFQRTIISGGADVSDTNVIMIAQATNTYDALAGARAFLRPLRWMSLMGAVDVGVVGSSSNTWSASVDASAQLTRRFLLSLGYRTMTMENDTMAIRMHGPRAALQLTF